MYFMLVATKEEKRRDTERHIKLSKNTTGGLGRGLTEKEQRKEHTR